MLYVSALMSSRHIDSKMEGQFGCCVPPRVREIRNIDGRRRYENCRISPEWRRRRRLTGGGPVEGPAFRVAFRRVLFLNYTCLQGEGIKKVLEKALEKDMENGRPHSSRFIVLTEAAASIKGDFTATYADISSPFFALTWCRTP